MMAKGKNYLSIDQTFRICKWIKANEAEVEKMTIPTMQDIIRRQMKIDATTTNIRSILRSLGIKVARVSKKARVDAQILVVAKALVEFMEAEAAVIPPELLALVAEGDLTDANP